jgi:methyl-accepting chemotaxis protein
MTISHSQRRIIRMAAMAALASALFAFALQQAFGPAADPTWIAAVAGGCGMLAACRFGGRRATAEDSSLQSMNGEVDGIMIGAAETSHFVDSIKKMIEKDVQSAREIADSSRDSARSIKQVALDAESASRAAGAVRAESATAAAEAKRGLHGIRDAREEARAACERMTALQETSRRVQGITELITQISAQTTLLAMNAAIEAARAGVHGRGFTVVAGEVRQLAQRTREANEQIASMVRNMREQAELAGTGMTVLNERVADAASNVESVHDALARIAELARASEEENLRMAEASRASVESTLSMASAIAAIRDNMLATETELPRAADSAMMLADRAEVIVELLANAGIASRHDTIRAAAQDAARQIEQLFAEAIASGKISEADLFDRRYVPIPNTNPPKHTTRFDAFTDRVLPAVQEKLLADMPNLIYAGAVDNNGYFPTHNKKFAKPLTGDYDTDLANNRTKRIFSDRTGKRCGSNTKPFLLQTYKRDTGEVMHDLSIPIRVGGKHWGGFRVGYRSHEHVAPAVATVPASASAAPAFTRMPALAAS